MEDNIWVEQVQEVEEAGGRSYFAGYLQPYETFTSNKRELFDNLQREYGPCRGSVCQDRDDGTRQRIGWIFEKHIKWGRSGVAIVRTSVTLVSPETKTVMVPKQVHPPISL